jgi:hypothetical protein
MVSEAEKATRRNAALARKAATKPVVLPPRLPSEPPAPPEPLLVDDPSEAPAGWGDELDLLWDDGEPQAQLEQEPEPADEWERDDDVEPEAGDLELQDDVEPEAGDVEVQDEVEPEPQPEPEPEAEVDAHEIVIEVDPVPPPRPVRRREPLRARPADASSSADRARRRVRIRPTADDVVDASEGNGPVFRSDLAQPVSELPSFPRSVAGPTPEPPLSMPLRPIEPPPRRRRLRPLRGR